MWRLLLFLGLGVIVVPFSIIAGINFINKIWIPGDSNTWITFWGTYSGAIVGALTVYFVTNAQMKNQRNVQLESIRKQN